MVNIINTNNNNNSKLYLNSILYVTAAYMYMYIV